MWWRKRRAVRSNQSEAASCLVCFWFLLIFAICEFEFLLIPEMFCDFPLVSVLIVRVFCHLGNPANVKPEGLGSDLTQKLEQLF